MILTPSASPAHQLQPVNTAVSACCARPEAQPQRLATLTPTQTRYVDQTAKPGTRYIYSLSALGAAQESARPPEIAARR